MSIIKGVQLLIQVVKSSSIIKWFKKYYKLIAVGIIMVLTAFLFYYRSIIELKSKEIDRISNNYEYYVLRSSQQEEHNRILLLTIDEFKNSKDSLILQIHITKDKLKIKEKLLKQVQLLELKVVHDTTIIIKGLDFNVEIKPNSLTSIIINKQDSILTHKLDIRNTLTLFIKLNKEYRNKYKNWFVRLLHFDFKKKLTYKYQIDNSNNLIHIEETRLIEISK